MKIISLGLIFIILLGITTPIASAQRTEFTDISHHTAATREAINWAHSSGLVTGQGGKFLPDNPLTRSAFVLILWRYVNYPEPGVSPGFSDVPRNFVAFDSITWAHRIGLITGQGGRFYPAEPLTRQAMVLALYRHHLRTVGSGEFQKNVLDQFSDKGSISPIAVEAMQWAVSNGLITGNGSRLNPVATATRANTVVLLYNYNNLFNSVTPQGPLNPLTGLPIAAGSVQNRPLAISISNEPGAIPMNGISRADIVYEVLVEGGLTRMLGLYQDISGTGYVGSVRSARPYTAQIAESYDAIFVTVGGSPQAYDYIAKRGITHIDETTGRFGTFFTRDRNRIPGQTVLEYHSAVTSGSMATQSLPRYTFRKTHNIGFSNGLSFTNNAAPSGGRTANTASINFSSIKTSTFNYNIATNSYQMSQRISANSSDLIDINDGSRPAFTNLLILRTDVSEPPDWGSNRLNIRTTGSGTGFFINGGRVVDIIWSRASESSQFSYTLASNGSPVVLGRGKTYIGIIRTTSSAAFS